MVLYSSDQSAEIVVVVVAADSASKGKSVIPFAALEVVLVSVPAHETATAVDSGSVAIVEYSRQLIASVQDPVTQLLEI